MRITINEQFTYDGVTLPPGDYDVKPVVKDGVLRFELRRVR